MKKIISIFLAAITVLTLCAFMAACSADNTPEKTTTPAAGSTTEALTPSNTGTQTPIATPDPTQEPSTTAQPTQTPEEHDPEKVYDIVLTDGNADVGKSGATVSNGTVTISLPGIYQITGSTSSGEIIVNVSKDEQVELILAGCSITNPTGPAIFCDSADKLFITAKEGTTNTLADGKNYANPDGPNATIFSDDDLTIRGTGIINVLGKFKNGISSKNDIKIKDLTLNVESYNTGIRGKSSVTVSSGVITIDAGNDGIKSTEEIKQGKGFVEISGGTVTITAGDDGVQAATTLTLSGGVVKITADGKRVNSPVENITDGVLQ